MGGRVAGKGAFSAGNYRDGSKFIFHSCFHTVKLDQTIFTPQY